MKLNMKELTMVQPSSKDTPKKRLSNSNLDLVMARIHFPVVYFYKPNSSLDFFDIQILKDSLSKVLDMFYPMAGRLAMDENKRIEINCNGEGVLFIVAEAKDVDIDDFGDFTPSSELRQLVPTIDTSGDISSYPLILLQVTVFKCGGVSLGVGAHHTLADGTSMIHFTNTWAEMTRGAPVSIQPFIDRTLPRARVPPIVTYDHIEFHQPPSINTPLQTQKSQSSPTDFSCTAMVKITADQLRTLKAKVKAVNGKAESYSTYEALAAHIWRCVCKARDIPEDQATKLYVPTNGRFKLRPPIPLGYVGNAIFMSTTIASSGDLQSEPLINTARRIHNALARMDVDYLQSSLDCLELQPDLTALIRGPQTFKSPNININSWTRLPIYDVDFGWGRPIYMGPSSIVYEGIAYILPNPINDGCTLAICLETDDVLQQFQKFFYK